MNEHKHLGNGWCGTCDGVSEWVHVTCGRREGRWTHRELTVDDEREPRYGNTPAPTTNNREGSK